MTVRGMLRADRTLSLWEGQDSLLPTKYRTQSVVKANHIPFLLTDLQQ